MKNRADQMKTLIFSLLLCLVICWTGTGYAVESWPGKVTAEVNLRRTPGLDGKIFAFLIKGEEVLVREKQDDWYKIIVERETYGYIGWVYGKFVKKAPNEIEIILPPVKEEMERPDKAKDLSAEANIAASQSHSQVLNRPGLWESCSFYSFSSSWVGMFSGPGWASSPCSPGS